MKKLVALFLTAAIVTGCLGGCGNTIAPVQTQPTQPSPSQTQPAATEPAATEPAATQPTATEPAIGSADTYWVADAWCSPDGEGADGFEPLDSDFWALDLLIRPDGTALFRDIHEGVCLMDDSHRSLRWERSEDGLFQFYSQLYPAPVVTASCEGGTLKADYMGMTFTMQQAPIPQTPGEKTSPAELVGTWLMVGGETEGWQWEAMPGNLSSLKFWVTSYSGPLVLAADREERDTYGTLEDAAFALEVTLLDQPLYDGCENEKWSVRIGPASPVDANGCPTETEFCATLLNYNTLLLQQRYTLDGSPMVSYQTYARFPDIVSWRMPEYMELGLSNWDCVGYSDLSGNPLPLPKELEGLSICLNDDASCLIRYGDGRTAKGVWQLEHGGVMLLRSPDEAEASFWFAGAVSGYCIETTYEISDAYQMSLYYAGGIIKLVFVGYG